MLEMIRLESNEDRRQLALLTSPEETGRTRYGAAMYFYMRGQIGPETLEVYRVCSGLDEEDPVASLKALGLSHEIQSMN
jgi:hypothetical protein